MARYPLLVAAADTKFVEYLLLRQELLARREGGTISDRSLYVYMNVCMYVCKYGWGVHICIYVCMQCVYV
jgi:hypothetical protein